MAKDPNPAGLLADGGAAGASGLFQYVLEKGALHRNPVRKVSAAAAAAHFS